MIMRLHKSLLWFIVLSMFVVLASCSTAKKVTRIVMRDTEPKKKVALMGIANRTEFAMDEYAQALEQILLTTLDKEKSLLVVTPADIKAAGFNPVMSRDLRELERFIPYAKQMGLNAIITGDISELEIVHNLYGIYGLRKEKPTLQMILRMKLVDVETRTVLFEGYRRAKMKLDLPASADTQMYLKQNKILPASFMDDIVEDMGEDIESAMADQPWKSYIAAIDGNTVQFPAGQDVGLKDGNNLVVLSEGKQLVNYAGQKFRLPGSQIGSVRCAKVEQSTTIAEIVEGDGFKVGDVLTVPD